MSDFVDMIIDLLPTHSPLHNENNEFRKFLDRSLGTWFDEHKDLGDGFFITSATGKWLDLHGRELDVPRRIDESDESYRERLIFEKLEYLTCDNLKNIYGLDLYCFVENFDATNNDLTSDNYYVGNIKMANAGDLENILTNKFIFGNELVWLHNNKIDQYKDIDVSVDWVDENNFDLNRPSSVTVSLIVGGTVVGTETASASNEWKVTFENVPVYAHDGIINYTLEASPVTDYDIVVNGFGIVYIYNPETLDLIFKKEWDKDGNTVDLPDSVTTTLKVNNTNYKNVIVTSDNNWSKTVNVPLRYNGNNASYSWVEEVPANWVIHSNTTSDNVTTIVNKYRGNIELPL